MRYEQRVMKYVMSVATIYIGYVLRDKIIVYIGVFMAVLNTWGLFQDHMKEGGSS